MQLPDPTLAFTLPSLHDGTPLDCRVYLPPSILALAGAATATTPSTTAALPWSPDSPRWRGHAAIVAHPYAPMGGSYNDPIVKMVAQTLLQRPDRPESAEEQFVVATFNFRGAGRKPQGRTSWTAKPEAADYMTVAGFLYYFVHGLDPYGEKEQAQACGSAAATPPPPAPPPALLFAGYSYGAMVTSLLPPLAAVLALFAKPLRVSPAAEVRRRAARWAAIQNADFAACREKAAVVAAAAKAAKASPAQSPTKARRSEARLSMGVRVGGGGSDEDHWRRRSHEVGSSSGSGRRSLSGDHHHRGGSGGGGDGHVDAEKGRHGVARLVARVRHSSSKDSEDAAAEEDNGTTDTMPVIPGLPAVRPAYLLVSPPVGLATNLATLSFGAAAASALPSAGGGLFKRRKAAAQSSTDGSTDEGEADKAPSTDEKLAANPTLVVYGDADGFVSTKKMRQWTARLGAAAVAPAAGPQRRFRSLEVPTAGHFWAEGRTSYELQAAVDAFAAEVVGKNRPA